MNTNQNFRLMKDKDWKFFLKFSKENYINSFVRNKKFNNFWFKIKNQWTIYVVKVKNSFGFINMFLVFEALYKGKPIKLCWTSTAIINNKLNIAGKFGLTMISLIKLFPVVIMSCGNKKSIPINKTLGYEIKNLKFRRFIFVDNIDCLKLVKFKYRKKIKKLIIKTNSINFDKKFKKELTESPPKDLDKLWNKFSKNFDLCILKNLKYFKKRYENAPFQKYYFLQFRDKKSFLIGISVLRFHKTEFGTCTRIVDFMSFDKIYSKAIWSGTIDECKKYNSLYVDFFVYGSLEDKNLERTGFKTIKELNHLSKIPNLLSPLEYRDWSYSFHLSGKHMFEKQIKKGNKVWFTKGDGDRDWPTPHDIKYNEQSSII